MGDLSDKYSSETIKIVGADLNGNESEYVEAASIDGKGRLLTQSLSSHQPNSGQAVRFATNMGSRSLLVNGAILSREFLVPADASRDFVVTEMRFMIVNTDVKMEGSKFIKGNSLTRGILVAVRSGNEQTLSIDPLKTSIDLVQSFSWGGTGKVPFTYNEFAGNMLFAPTFVPDGGMKIYKTGTFASDDFVKVTVRDDISNYADNFTFCVRGYYV